MSQELKYKLYSSSDCIPEQRMFDYIDNKLSPKEQHEVEKHLIDCEFCSDAMDGLRSLKNRERIKTLNKEALERISKTETKVVPFNKPLIISIAAGLLLLVGSVFFFNMFMNGGMKEEAMADLKEAIPAEQPATVAAPGAKADSVSATPPPPPAVVTEEISRSVDAESSIQSDKKTLDVTFSDVEKNAEQEVVSKTSPAFEQPIADESPKKEKPIQATPAESKDRYINLGPASGTTNNTTTTNNNISEVTTLSKEKAKDQNDANGDTDLSVAAGSGNAGKISDKESLKEREEKQAKNTNYKGQKADGKKKTEERKENNKLNKTVSEESANAPVNIALNTAKTADIVMQDSVSTSGYLDDNLNAPFVVEEMAEFPGGSAEMIKFLNSNLKWPSTDAKNTEGIALTKIIVRFVVEKDGSITNPKILKGINPAFDAEALRVVKLMPKWKPAKDKGKVISQTINLPIQLEFR